MYEFTNNWFEGLYQDDVKVVDIPAIWRDLFQKLKPVRFLEIGSFEGRSACFTIDERAQTRPITLFCIDTWMGGAEHASFDMDAVEARFDRNVALAMERAPRDVHFRKIKARSTDALASLLVEGYRGIFDFIYVDGSHAAKDVLADLVMAFPLLRKGGMMVADDHLWDYGRQSTGDPLQNPKPGIDAFTNIYAHDVAVLPGQPGYQCYMVKTGK